MADPTQRDQAVKELKIEALRRSGGPITFRVVGGSMRYFLREGDEVVVEKTDVRDVRLGDILAFKSAEGDTGAVSVHRVVRRLGDGSFVTKGDHNASCDRHRIAPAEIIGKVCVVKKSGSALELNIASKGGYFLSCAAGLASSALSPAERLILACAGPLRRMFRSWAPETGYSCDPRHLLACAAAAGGQDWRQNVDATRELIRGHGGAGLSWADISPAGGFSEEAMALAREGIPVTFVSVDDMEANFSSCRYDRLLAVRLLNLAPDRPGREQLLFQLHRGLGPGGILVASWVNPPREPARRLRRAVYGTLLGKRYAGPPPDALVENNIFLRRRLKVEDVVSEMKAAGFRVVECRASGNSIAVAAEKRG